MTKEKADIISTREDAVKVGMTMTELLNLQRDATSFLDKKGIRTAVARHQSLESNDSPNILYLTPKGVYLETPVNEHQDLLEKARASGWVIEIPVDGNRDYSFALIRGARAVKAKLGAVTLADVIPIPYADKGEVKKFITRLKKSKAEAELTARGEELQDLINQYEQRENDTENDTLQEKFESIREALENCQQELEKGFSDNAINEVEEALYF